MLAFTVVWLGQVISMLGTGGTRFALGIWAWDQTGQATPLALVALASFGPSVLLSPIAGALVDRWNRKLVMMLSDLAAGLSTIGLLILFATGNLEIWHIIVAGAFASAFESFQFPAYSASITMMIPREQFARAQGMMSIAEASSGIISPMIAGSVLGLLGIQQGINILMIIDIITFLFALGAVFFVHIPQPERSAEGRKGQGNLIEEVGYGFQYILSRPSLFGLQMVFFFINLTATFAMVVMTPMVLARTDSNPLALTAISIAGPIGGLLGGVLLTAWGGPKRKTDGVLGGMFGASLLGELVIGLGRGIPLWVIGSFFTSLFIPIINGSNQAIWQSKVEPDLQGRVFATRRWIAQITAPVAMLLAGPAADQVFEPAMREGGALVPVFGPIVGVGPGAGMSIMFLITGVLGMLVALIAYTVPAVRNAESILPDAKIAVKEEDKDESAITTEPAAEPA